MFYKFPKKVTKLKQLYVILESMQKKLSSYYIFSQVVTFFLFIGLFWSTISCVMPSSIQVEWMVCEIFDGETEKEETQEEKEEETQEEKITHKYRMMAVNSSSSIVNYEHSFDKSSLHVDEIVIPPPDTLH